MTRDEIYEHLAKVYLGKRDNVQQNNKKRLNAWFVINAVITVIILASTFYGFTAFLTRRGELKNSIIYSLNNNPIRISYNLNDPYPQSEAFTLMVPHMDVSKYHQLNLAIRGMAEDSLGAVKIVVTNERNEKAAYFLQNIRSSWQKFNIPFTELNITDWTNITNVAIILESWNVSSKKGTVLIDDISFSN